MSASLSGVEPTEPGMRGHHLLPGVPMTLALPSGQRLAVRFVQPSDAGPLRSLYERLDAEAIQRRFFTNDLPPPGVFERLVSISERHGCSLVVADVATGLLVAEADFELLRNGNAEIAMTASHPWRGWMGPFLLALLCQVADARGVPNFEAEILSTDAMLRAAADVDDDVSFPAPSSQTVRVAFSTRNAAPRIAEEPRPGDLVDMRASAFDAIARMAAGGYDVTACLERDHAARCRLDCEGACSLMASADLVVVAGVADDR